MQSRKSKTLLQIIPFLTPGAANHAYNICSIFTEMQHMIICNPDIPSENLHSEKNLEKKFLELGCKIGKLPVFKRKVFNLAYSTGAFSKLVTSVRPGYIISHTGNCSMITFLACSLTGVRPTHISVVHGWGLNKKKWQRIADVFALSKANHVIAVSEAIKEQMICEGVEEQKLKTINYGHKVKPGRKKDLYKELSMPEQNLLVLTAGRLVREKNPDLLLDIACLCKTLPVSFILAGDGPLKNRLKSRIEKDKLNVKLLGFREDILDLYSSADIFLLTSRYDALPFAVIEALANSLPVVACPVGGIPEMVEHEHNGFLIQTAEQGKLALCELLDNKHKLKDYGKRSRAIYNQRFSPEMMKKAYSILLGVSNEQF